MLIMAISFWNRKHPAADSNPRFLSFCGNTNIRMEDPGVIALELSLAIMYHRCDTGHPLPPEDCAANWYFFRKMQFIGDIPDDAGNYSVFWKKN